MGSAEDTFDFDLELKKRSSLATFQTKIATLLIGSQDSEQVSHPFPLA